MRPVLRHVANLWTLMQHPSREREWTLDEKLDAIQAAGFDSVCWAPSPELTEGLKQRGLTFVGGMASGDVAAFPALLDDLQHAGALHVNVQLGGDEMLTPEALRLTLTLMKEAKERGLRPAIESHRGTCTETPEKMYALADAYQQATGELLPISWDFSHFAVVKHLVPRELRRAPAGAAGTRAARATVSFPAVQRTSRASAHHRRARRADAGGARLASVC